MQAGGEGEVAEVIGRELKFVAGGGQRELLYRHHPRVVDQNVQRSGPGPRERPHTVQIGQVQGGDPDFVVSGRRAQVGGDAIARGGVTDGQCHGGSSGCKRSCSFDADTRCGAGDDGRAPGQVDPGDHIRRGRFEAEGRGDGSGHASQQQRRPRGCSPRLPKSQPTRGAGKPDADQRLLHGGAILVDPGIEYGNPVDPLDQ